jgi:predicted ester cyclase
MSDINKQLVTDWLDAVNAKDREGLMKPWADQFVVHVGAGFGEITDADHLTGVIEGFWRAIPDLSIETCHLIAEGDLVAVHVRTTGTHGGAFAGRAATGNRIDFSGYGFFRCTPDGLAEEWILDDLLTFLIQVGAVPADVLTAGAGAGA